MPLNANSLRLLSKVHPHIAGVMIEASDVAAQMGMPFIVTQGLRTIEEQKALYAQGRTTPGKIVTWTMNSRHLTGQAVDIAMLLPNGQVSWDERAYDKIMPIIMGVAKRRGIPIIWGGTFLDKNGKPQPDKPHYELDRRVYH